MSDLTPYDQGKQDCMDGAVAKQNLGKDSEEYNQGYGEQFVKFMSERGR